MNRLSDFGFLPNLSTTIKFVGGPWDGMYARWLGKELPEFVETSRANEKAHVPHVYQLWVFTDNKGVTHNIYKHRGAKESNEP